MDAGSRCSDLRSEASVRLASGAHESPASPFGQSALRAITFTLAALSQRPVDAAVEPAELAGRFVGGARALELASERL